MTPKLVLTLVHGTFVTAETSWVKSGSALRNRLEGRFGEAIHFEPFDWHPADNTIAARTAGADKLSLHLARMQHDYPHATQYIVAHSHGGNVAIRGANQYIDACIETSAGVPNLWGIACLSTPFIHATVRDLRGLTDANLWWWLYGLFFVVGQVASLWLGAPRFIQYWWLVSGLLAAVVGGLISGLFDRLVREVDFDKVATTLRSSIPPGSNVLIIRGAGDEASLVLDTAGLFSRYLTKTFGWLTEHQVNPSWRSSRVLAWLHDHGLFMEEQAERLRPLWRHVRLPKIVWMGWAALLGVLLMMIVRNGLSLAALRNLELPPSFWAAAETLLLLTAAIKTTLLDFLLYPTALIILGSISALGWKTWGTTPAGASSRGGGWRQLVEGLVFGLMIEVTAEALPQGMWSAIQLGLDIAGAQETRGLRHSVYADPRCHDELVNWLVKSELERRLTGLQQAATAKPGVEARLDDKDQGAV